MRGLIGLEFLGETTSSTINVLRQTSVQGEAVFRPSGLLQHANLLGVYLAIAIALAMAMLLISRRIASRTFFLGCVLLFMPAEVVAMSRSAWVSAATSLGLLLFFMFLHPRLRLRSLVATVVAGIIGVAVFASMFDRITQRLLRSKDDATTAREIYKADAKRMIAASPVIGLGLNSYAFELPNYATLKMANYGDQPPAVHNIFYMWWAETGIVGMAIFCIVWGSIIWTGFRNLSVNDELLFVANAACLAGIIGFLPDSFFSFTLRVNTTLRLFWFLAAVIMAVRYLRLREAATLPAAGSREPAGVISGELQPVPDA
jgi:O-antigen ligase